MFALHYVQLTQPTNKEQTNDANVTMVTFHQLFKTLDLPALVPPLSLFFQLPLTVQLIMCVFQLIQQETIHQESVYAQQEVI